MQRPSADDPQPKQHHKEPFDASDGSLKFHFPPLPKQTTMNSRHTDEARAPLDIPATATKTRHDSRHDQQDVVDAAGPDVATSQKMPPSNGMEHRGTQTELTFWRNENYDALHAVEWNFRPSPKYRRRKRATTRVEPSSEEAESSGPHDISPSNPRKRRMTGRGQMTMMQGLCRCGIVELVSLKAKWTRAKRRPIKRGKKKSKLLAEKLWPVVQNLPAARHSLLPAIRTWILATFRVVAAMGDHEEGGE